MKKFLSRFGRFISIGIIPLLVLLGTYFYLDPFKVIYTYPDYSHLKGVVNRDFISTTMFLKNKHKYRYNAFVFGSSRTLAYRPLVWKQYLPKSARPFMFDASAEKISDIYTKIKFLDSINQPIDHALIILCRNVSFENTKKHDGHLFIHHPAVTHRSWTDFHLTFIKAYLSPYFLVSYHTFRMTGKYQPWMKDYLQESADACDPVTNAIDINALEQNILQNPIAYYAQRKALFYHRDSRAQIDETPRMTQRDFEMLQEIVALFKKRKTDYKVVVSPLYEQIKLNPDDKKKLVEIFGHRLYDFSGKNAFTENPHNYYETSHYRPIVGNTILKQIYQAH